MNTDMNSARAAVWYAVAQLCDEDESKTGTKFSPTFVDALSHVVFSQAETMGADLECFAKHAKRAKISVDDVKLCARRNEHLLELLAGKAEPGKASTKNAQSAQHTTDNERS
ncbi:kinetochore component CENP-S-domain-containing protein [Kickxella alabastrina]|uniref:kinetochore component CENP-S-domain-containing protein n=1 Tax=Kickxella alabastrina TaxID=61397 RepID=UPI00222043AB|nr:kinetochore component CENP-S-domain-containing protein [Kickxella alabastrina]KAI7830024.1 kinetochore component CENP-S-domain-containing protein [Kickxella alabastrina]